MKALSLSQPWAAVVAAGLKSIENRSWKPHAAIIGHTFAIHAAKSYDREAVVPLTNVLGERWRSVPHLDARGAIIGTARLTGFVEASSDPFFFGPYGLLLDGITALTPIPCRGALGFWEIPDDVQIMIEEQQ